MKRAATPAASIVGDKLVIELSLADVRPVVEVRPACVTQHSFAHVFGGKARHYIEAARRGEFPSVKRSGAVVARFADVLAWWTSAPEAASNASANAEPANDLDGVDGVLASVGLRRKGGAK